MEWYQYIAAFFSGAFSANAVPHFVHGISGNKFPTPFSKPPGVGLSPSSTNVIWALFNIIVGYLLLKTGKVDNNNVPSLITFFIGITVISIMLSISFQRKHKE